MKPRVLIATTCRWFSAARLAISLANAGFDVDAVCPSHHPLALTSVVRHPHRYHGIAPLRSFASAVSATSPDIIIPCDELALRHLHELYYRAESRGRERSAVCALIERSLGAPRNFRIVSERASFVKIAEEEGIRGPRTQVISDTADLMEWTAKMGFPVVLKSDGTSGGDGVRIARTPQQAENAFHALQAPPSLARAAKRILVDRDARSVWPSILRNQPVISAQTFVEGPEATSTIACWEGTVLASLHCEVLNKHPATGPATVLRLIENADMSTAAEKIARRLGLSGIHGLDFMLETGTGKAHLIEINPRATQVGHLTLGSGRDLPAALYGAVTRNVVNEAPSITDKDTITLFPREWLRNPASPFIQSSYHDIPWEEPEFIRACVGTRRKHADLYSQCKADQPCRQFASPLVTEGSLPVSSPKSAA
jgi:predicted ATP-grasp superfamily ATP-dependent carboligase